MKLNEGKSATEMELQHDSYQGMGECLYVQVSESANIVHPETLLGLEF